MVYKSIFLSDIDGTLVDRYFQIPHKVIAAADEYQKSGGMLVLSTGRAPVSTKDVAKTMNIVHPCVVFSGAGIYDFLQEKLIWSNPMDGQVIRAVEYVLQRYPDISVKIFTDVGIYLLRNNETLEQKGVKTEYGQFVADISAVKGKLLKILLVGADISQLEECGRQPVWKGVKYQFASRHFVEIVNENTDKSVAMKTLIKQYGISEKQVFAAGDGMTDYTMLANSTYAFVPEHAPEILQKLGKVIDGPERGGMATAFKSAQEFNLASK